MFYYSKIKSKLLIFKFLKTLLFTINFHVYFYLTSFRFNDIRACLFLYWFRKMTKNMHALILQSRFFSSKRCFSASAVNATIKNVTVIGGGLMGSGIAQVINIIFVSVHVSKLLFLGCCAKWPKCVFSWCW